MLFMKSMKAYALGLNPKYYTFKNILLPFKYYKSNYMSNVTSHNNAQINSVLAFTKNVLKITNCASSKLMYLCE